MAELSLVWRRDSSSKKLVPEGKVELPEEEAVQDLVSILYPEFPEAVKQLATIAAKKAISPENAVSLHEEEEERGHQPKVPMVDASSVMKRATKRLTVQIEEAEVAVVEEGLDPVPEASPEKDQHLVQEARTRKSKLTHFVINLI